MKKFCMIMLVLMMVALPVFAQDTTVTEEPQVELWTAIWDILVKCIVVLMSLLVGWVINLVKKKFNIDISKAHQEQLKNWAIEAIYYAEEWGKVKLTDKANKGEEKFKKAVSKLLAKVPGIDQKKAEELIVTYLPEGRALIERYGDKLAEMLKNKTK